MDIRKIFVFGMVGTFLMMAFAWTLGSSDRGGREFISPFDDMTDTAIRTEGTLKRQRDSVLAASQGSSHEENSRWGSIKSLY